MLAAAALSLAVLTWIARRFYRISGRLREQLEENRRLEDELRALTITDPGTGLRNPGLRVRHRTGYQLQQ